jgi:2-polyprenyl-3-methyl-5-hydroxy-6-metoxy-1,4-benzoquinol methylase
VSVSPPTETAMAEPALAEARTQRAGKVEERYEFKPFRYSSHDWILKTLEAEKAPVKILDVGTAGGYLGKVWTGQGHSVTGVEFDAATAEKAMIYYDAFHVADLETFAFPYRRAFDYIVFADVLEHLRDPAAVLRRCMPALKDGGKIIVSVPNVANWIVRLSLLCGKFDYMDRGILDRTHLRFFTLRSLQELMGEVSCEVLDVTATPLPFQLVLPFTAKKVFAPFHAAHYALTCAWKKLFAYQFVITAAPAGTGLPARPEDESAPARELANQ